MNAALSCRPTIPEGVIDLAKIYIHLGLLDAASSLVKEMPEKSKPNQLDLLRVEVSLYLAKNDFTDADKLLVEEHNKNPTDVKLNALTAEFYRSMGYGALPQGAREVAATNSTNAPAALWFKKALAAMDEELRLLDPTTTDAREISEIHFRKAELEMTALKDYAAATNSLNVVVKQNSGEVLPLATLAFCEFQLNQLDAAKRDYEAAEKMVPQPPYMVYYGFTETAKRQNISSEEIRYDDLYLKCARRDTPEFTNITQRLRELKGH